jgi:hypothetical protein
MQNSKKLQPVIKIILWSALFMTNFLYMGLSYTLTGETAFISDDQAYLNRIFLVLGIVMLALSFIIPRLLTKLDKSVNEAVPFILSLALNEAASLFAFIIGFIGKDQGLSIALFGVSIVGFLLKFPKKSSAAPSSEVADNNRLNVE